MAVQAGSKRAHQPNITPPPNSRFGHIDTGYGVNGPQPSSIPPGASVTSVLADSLRAGQADADDTLGKVIAKGVAKNDALDSFQQRKGSDTPYPTTFGMRGPAPAKTVPAELIDDEAQPVRGHD
jgi:hypothetical protein